MTRRTAFVLYLAIVALLSASAVNADAFKGTPINSGSRPATATAAEPQPTTVAPEPTTTAATPQPRVDLAEIVATLVREPATTTTSTTKLETTTTTLKPSVPVTTVPVTAPVPTTTAPALATAAPAIVAQTCDRLEINIAATTLVAHCTDGVKDFTKSMAISSGSGEFYENPATGKMEKADTPRGSFRVYWMDPGWAKAPLGWMYNSIYFKGGFAIHGDPLVPSHGCVHVTETSADWLYERVDIGTVVNIT